MRDGYIDHGFEGAAVRRSCALPLAWGLPSHELLGRVVAEAARLADGRRTPRPSDVARLRAAGLVLLAFQTGREISNDGMLSVRRADDLAAALDQPGAVITQKGAFLIVPPSGGGRRASDEDQRYRSVTTNIVLPLIRPLHRVIDRLLALDGKGEMCFLGNGTEAAVHQLLRGTGDWRVRTTKAGRRLTTAHRWLRHRVRVIEGGDAALYAMLNPAVPGSERTLSSYSTVSADRFWRLYRVAIAPLDATIPLRPPPALADRSYGHQHCPADTPVLQITKQILSSAGAKPKPSALSVIDGRLTAEWQRQHLAVMMRCYIAVTFGTGQRGIGSLPRLEDVDAESGFAWVVEKSNPRGGYGGGRGVFHPRAVRRHLAAYEDYLDRLGRLFKKRLPAAARQLAALRAEPGVTFFRVKRNGELMRLSQGALCRAAARIGWHYTPNAGRRWLRSALIGQVPSDALAAQFGHHLDGLDVWNHHSGISPHAVAAALEPAIHQAMARIGLDTLPRTQRLHLPEIPNPAEATITTDNRRFRAGQILASAIWNGAMLDQSKEASLIAELSEAIAREALPSWIEFELEARLNQPRWHIDPVTRDLLAAYRRDGFDRIAGEPDRLLAEFLGIEKTPSSFRKAARSRWRWRMPPLLLAKAKGELVNHSVRGERFIAGRRLPVPRYGDRPRSKTRSTCGDLVTLFEEHGRRSEKNERFPWQRKRRLHGELSAALQHSPLLGRMTPLERSLAFGLVDGLRADRGKDNPTGYSVTTQIDRARRLWRLFIPIVPADWEAVSIDRLDVATVQKEMFPLAPWRNNVAGDLLTLLRPLPETRNTREMNAFLKATEENYTADLLHPSEYRQVRRNEGGDPPWITQALMLCYRTGLRFSELGCISSDRLDASGSNLAGITLDHHSSRRLKTLHSRRYIPLDVLLDEQEERDFVAFLKPRSVHPFGWLQAGEQEELGVAINRTTKVHVGLHPFRHAFATNALAALLWPSVAEEDLMHHFDPLLLSRRQMLRDRLCGAQSLGATAPHALACVLGHTSPYRTLFSYAHHLEVLLAAHVRASASVKPVLALTTPCFRPSRRQKEAQALAISDPNRAGQIAA